MRRIPTLIALLVAAVTASTCPAADLDEVIRRLQDAGADARRAAWNEARELDAYAVPRIAALVDSETPEIALAASIALRNLAHASAAPGREAARKEVAAALARLLGDARPSLTLKRLVLDLLSSVGGEAEVAAITPLLRDAELRDAARRTLERIPGDAPLAALRAALPAAEGDFRTALIRTLGYRRDAAAERRLRDIALDAGASEIDRVEAARALLRIRPSDLAGVIRPVIEASSDRHRRLIGDEVLRLADRYGEEGDAERAKGLYRLVLRRAAHDVLRHAALHALSSPPGREDLDDLLLGLGDASERVRTLAAERLATLDAEGVDERLREGFENATGSEKAAALRALHLRKAEGIAALVQSASRSEDVDVRVTALSLSGDIDDPGLAPMLIDAAREGSEAVRDTALASYLRLASRAAASDRARAAEMFGKALELARDRTQSDEALLGLAGTGAASAEAPIAEALRDDARRSVARGAQVAYARAIGSDPERKDRAVELLMSVMASDAPRELIRETAAALADLGADPTLFQKKQGFVASWKVIGPFPNDDYKGWDAAYFPEERLDFEGVQRAEIGGRERRFAWRDHTTHDLEGIVDLERLFRRTQNVCAYAYAEVESSEERDVLLKVGSDDGIVVWVNGEKAHANRAVRPCAVDQDTAKARLAAGKNRILVKALQLGGQWAFCVRLATPDGKPLDLTRTGGS